MKKEEQRPSRTNFDKDKNCYKKEELSKMREIKETILYDLRQDCNDSPKSITVYALDGIPKWWGLPLSGFVKAAFIVYIDETGDENQMIDAVYNYNDGLPDGHNKKWSKEVARKEAQRRVKNECMPHFPRCLLLLPSNDTFRNKLRQQYGFE